PPDELIVGVPGQVEAEPTWGVLEADAVEAALEAVDPGGVALGVLVAVVAVVPVEDVEAAVGAGLLDHGHEPGVVGGEEVGGRLGTIRGTGAMEHVGVDAVAVDVAHVEPFAVLRWIGVAVVEVDPAVGGLLVSMIDDRVDL